MAGFGRNPPRHGKRASSSSTAASSFSTVTMVVFVAFCILGVWMLTSSSIIPSPATTTHHHSRASAASDSPPSRHFLKEPPGEDEVEDKPGSKLSMASLEAGSGRGDQETDGGSASSDGAEEETRLESEPGSGESLDNQRQQQRQNEGTQQEQQPLEKREEEGASAGDQQLSDQNAEGGNGGDNPQQSVSQQGEETQLQSEQQQSDSQNNDEVQNPQEEKQEVETGDKENRQEIQEQTGANGVGIQQEIQEQQEKQMWNKDEENRQETEQLKVETDEWGNRKETKQQEPEEELKSQTEIDVNHNQIQQPNPEEQTEEGAGETQSRPELQAVEGAGETQSQPELQADTQESSNDQQQEHPQTEDESTINVSDEGQQRGEEKLSDPNASDSLPDGAQSELPNEINGKKTHWSTQADQSENEKERRKGEESLSGSNIRNLDGYEWELCNVTAGPDYIPCLDNVKAIKQLHGIKHYEHRERHCPEESPTCLVPLPVGYRRPIEWPKSRDRIWYNNIPHTKLAEVKGHQNWVKVMGQYLTFPGGGTQFIHGALHYIDFIQQSVHDIAWGKHTRVILDVGCGVASFGGYLFERDVLTMSFAPKDEHEAQVQFALERGIPAISAVMGSQRLPFPSRVFDLVHCARCRVPWHADGGTLLLELNRVLRPGGYFVWSATPVYQKLKEDVEIWRAMKSLTISMCWDLVTIKKDKVNSVAAAFFRKPVSNECYENRKHHSPPMCKQDDDPNAAWYIPMKTCMHRVPVDYSKRGSRWPEVWPRRLQVPPYWLNSSQVGVYGKPAPDDFSSDYAHWKRVVTKSYLSGFGIDWSKVRNVMDMRAVYGGFAAALKDLKVWVMNVVNIDSPDTLPIIYERGLFGIYHDWCESFSTYPRTYDLLHADHLFSQLKERCQIAPVMAEVDRIVRPGGKLIVRDESVTVSEVENLLKSLHWEVRLTFSKDREGILCAEKSDWRPEKFSDSS